MTTILKDASNWREVFNTTTAIGSEFAFESVPDTTFVLMEFYPAHSIARGSKTAAKIVRKDNGEIVKKPTDELKAMYCPDFVRGTRTGASGGTRTRRFEVKNLESATIEELYDLQCQINAVLLQRQNEEVMKKISDLEKAKEALAVLGMDTSAIDAKLDELNNSLN